MIYRSRAAGRHRLADPQDPFTGPYLPNWLIDRHPY